MLLTELLLFFAFALNAPESDAQAQAQSRDLILRIREGDKQAFRTFFDQHQHALLSFLMSKGLDKPTSEDILQQAFITIWEKRANLDEHRSIKAFLFTIAYNRMLNYLRDTKKTQTNFAFDVRQDTDSTPDTNAENAQAMEAMQKALEQMPEKRRTVFEMCYVQELTYKEAAEILQITRKTVENHMALALKDLRIVLKNYIQN